MRRLSAMTATSFAVVYLWSAAVHSGETRNKGIDNSLYTTFAVSNNSLSYSVCGQLPDSFGCYGGGSLTGYEQACAVLQGTPTTKGNVMKRGLYVLDKRTSPTAPVLLYVYMRTDKITSTFDTVTVVLLDTINLGITGGAAAHCSMAADKGYIFAGTDASANAIRISKKNYTLLAFIGVGSGGTVENIVADQRGYISLKFGSGTDIIGNQGFTIQDGAEGVDLVGTSNAFIPR